MPSTYPCVVGVENADRCWGFIWYVQSTEGHLTRPFRPAHATERWV